LKTIQIIAVILLFTGCQKTDPPKPTAPERREYPQTCEMCGAKWLVTPNNPNDTVSPTIEWCFHDGHYCEIGFAMILDAEKNGQTNEKNRQWLNHCLTCQGCRCAAYDPAEWKKITGIIKELRSRSAKPQSTP